MPISVADGISKRILQGVIPNWNRAAFILDRASTMRDPGSAGILDLPEIDRPTLVEDGDAGGTPQTYNPSSSHIELNRNPLYNIRVSATDAAQLVEGGWLETIGRSSTQYLRSAMDERFVRDDVLDGPGATLANHINLAADTPGRADVENAIARLLSADGVEVPDLVWVASPYAQGALRASSEFASMTGQDGQNGALGIGQIGFLSGIPLFVSKSVSDDNGAAAAADLSPATYRKTLTGISSSSGTVTAVMASHNFQVGQQVRILGCSESALNGSGTVTSVTSTNVVVDISGSGTVGSAATPGFMAADSAMAILFARNRAFSAVQVQPSVRTVPLDSSTAWSVQISSIWGAQCLANSAVVMHSPANSVA